jgi:hypothetical protein
MQIIARGLVSLAPDYGITARAVVPLFALIGSYRHVARAVETAGVEFLARPFGVLAGFITHKGVVLIVPKKFGHRPRAIPRISHSRDRGRAAQEFAPSAGDLIRESCSERVADDEDIITVDAIARGDLIQDRVEEFHARSTPRVSSLHGETGRIRHDEVALHHRAARAPIIAA